MIGSDLPGGLAIFGQCYLPRKHLNRGTQFDQTNSFGNCLDKTALLPGLGRKTREKWFPSLAVNVFFQGTGFQTTIFLIVLPLCRKEARAFRFSVRGFRDDSISVISPNDPGLYTSHSVRLTVKNKIFREKSHEKRFSSHLTFFSSSSLLVSCHQLSTFLMSCLVRISMSRVQP